MSLLIGLPFNQLSSVSSVSAGIENTGGVYADGSDVGSCCGSRLICLPSSLETWAADASGAVDGLDEHAIGGVYVESEGVRWICVFGPLDVWATVASGAVDGLDEHAASANATAAPTIVPVIDLVMVFMFFSFFKNKSYNESE